MLTAKRFERAIGWEGLLKDLPSARALGNPIASKLSLPRSLPPRGGNIEQSTAMNKGSLQGDTLYTRRDEVAGVAGAVAGVGAAAGRCKPSDGP